MYFEYIFKVGIQLVKIIVLLYGLKYIYDTILLAYFGPLSKIPGPKVTFLSNLFITVRQINGQRWKWLQYEIVPKYGSLVRVGPKMIVVSDKDMVKQDIIGETAFGGSFKLVREGNHPLPRKVFQELRRRVLVSGARESDLFIFNISKKLIERFIKFQKSAFPIFGSFLKVDPYLIDFTSRIIEERRASTSTRKDLLQVLLDTKNMTDGGLSDFEVFDQCIEFLIAGSDTTNFATSMTMLELIRHPDVFKKLVEELDDALSKEEDSERRLVPSHDKLKNLPYLNAVINEGLRLYPSTRGPGKLVTEDIVIGGYLIPKGTSLTVNIFGVHRSKEYWGEDSNEFIPERWLNPENIPADGFIPFSAVALVSRYEFQDIPGQDEEMLHFVTTGLRTKSHNVKVRHRIEQ
ncbi:6848_t:CDS:10 [Acaulospora colombiana]|uniref:6848_t:CDS:1 n=1 Tax=Acaulospora colombiana TaxID=27376 RepID=A0ACA9KG27_9GLOM|nr:6848_t:CDS:10 [Acaulospora colombiana]